MDQDGLRSTVLDIPDLWQFTCYIIGGMVYSLDDIEHGILRGTVAMTILRGTVAMTILRGTVAMIILRGTVAMIILRGTVAMIILRGTVAMTIRVHRQSHGKLTVYQSVIYQYSVCSKNGCFTH